MFTVHNIYMLTISTVIYTVYKSEDLSEASADRLDSYPYHHTMYI